MMTLNKRNIKFADTTNRIYSQPNGMRLAKNPLASKNEIGEHKWSEMRRKTACLKREQPSNRMREESEERNKEWKKDLSKITHSMRCTIILWNLMKILFGMHKREKITLRVRYALAAMHSAPAQTTERMHAVFATAHCMHLYVWRKNKHCNYILLAGNWTRHTHTHTYNESQCYFN